MAFPTSHESTIESAIRAAVLFCIACFCLEILAPLSAEFSDLAKHGVSWALLLIPLPWMVKSGKYILFFSATSMGVVLRSSPDTFPCSVFGEDDPAVQLVVRLTVYALCFVVIAVTTHHLLHGHGMTKQLGYTITIAAAAACYFVTLSLMGTGAISSEVEQSVFYMAKVQFVYGTLSLGPWVAYAVKTDHWLLPFLQLIAMAVSGCFFMADKPGQHGKTWLTVMCLWWLCSVSILAVLVSRRQTAQTKRYQVLSISAN